MELYLPEQIFLDDLSEELLADVDEAARRVDDRRPLAPEVVRRIDDELFGKRVHGSNAIEGNTLDLRETEMILRGGIDADKRRTEKGRTEALEARNLGDAIKKVSTWIDADPSCHSADRLREIHAIILREIDDQWAGRFREHGVMIRGAKYQPPDHGLVPALVDRVFEQHEKCADLSPLVRATWTHWALARIHPFHDGNGRIARLWQDIVLLQGRLACAIIRPEDRREYLDALTTADEGEFNPLIQLVSKRVSSTLDVYVDQIKAVKTLDQFVAELVGESNERIQQRTELLFVKWSQRMQQLRRAFELCASRFTEASGNIQVQIRPYELIDQTRWGHLRSGLRAEKTWFFVADFSVADRWQRYIFFFGRHFWSDQDTDADRSQQRVSLLISEKSGEGEPPRLDNIANCPIRLREIFLVDDSFVCKYVELGAKESSYQRGLDPLTVAQDFIRDVVLYRMS